MRSTATLYDKHERHFECRGMFNRIYRDIITADYLLDIPGIDVFSLATVRYGIETLLWIIFDKPR